MTGENNKPDRRKPAPGVLPQPDPEIAARYRAAADSDPLAPRDRGGRFRRGEETQLRDQEALKLRLQGHSLAEIAATMDVSVATAHRMVQRGLRDASPVREVEELRAEQAAQIDALIAAIWPRAVAGSARHAEVICRLIERKAKLLGLDAPAVTQVEVITRDVLERALAELEADIARIESGELPPGEGYE